MGLCLAWAHMCCPLELKTRGCKALPSLGPWDDRKIATQASCCLRRVQEETKNLSVLSGASIGCVNVSSHLHFFDCVGREPEMIYVRRRAPRRALSSLQGSHVPSHRNFESLVSQLRDPMVCLDTGKPSPVRG